MARQIAALVLAMLAAPAAHAAVMHASSNTFLSTDNGQRMRPDVVANTLVNVEEEWRKLAADFTEGAGSVAKDARDSFAKSCATVVSAVIQGSGGDRDVAREYMNNVCSQKILAGWHATRCSALATRITDHAMLADSYANRQNLKPAKVCNGYWSIFVEAERNREAEEAKERAEKDKIRAEEEKKAQEAAAEAKKKADAAAKIEAELRAKEEAKRKEEEAQLKAKEEAAEARARAAEAAARLAEKKAEAEKVQQEAQKKLEEAKQAEEEHKARLAEHQKAEEILRSAAKPLEAAVTKAAAPQATQESHVEGPPPLSPAAPQNAAPVAKPAAKPAVAAADAKAATKPAVQAAKAADKTAKK